MNTNKTVPKNQNTDPKPSVEIPKKGFTPTQEDIDILNRMMRNTAAILEKKKKT
ncbi:MAG: hypothetical protein K2N56_11950 [Oscillospiraceae bacterium]|nr:hypothetical protein [Oscillospiraceae bacterium]